MADEWYMKDKWYVRDAFKYMREPGIFTQDYHHVTGRGREFKNVVYYCTDYSF